MLPPKVNKARTEESARHKVYFRPAAARGVMATLAAPSDLRYIVGIAGLYPRAPVAERRLRAPAYDKGCRLMPRYFFNVIDGKNILDEEGTELPDRAAVRAEAIRTSGEMLTDMGDAWDGEHWQMNVADESGRVVFRLQFSATELAEAAE